MIDPPPELRAFCLRQHPRLVRALDLHLGDLDLAEDLAQETLMVVCRRWRKVATARSPSAYAYRIAFNLANSHFRRRKAEAKAHRTLVAGRPTDVSAEEVARDLALREALASLPRKERAAVVLHHYVGYRVAEIAPLLGTTAGTVKSLLHRGRGRLRQHLAPPSEGPTRTTEPEARNAR